MRAARARRRAPSATAKGAVYRIAPDGAWDQVWESREDVPYDVTFDQSGAPIIATGNKGKLYRLEGDPLRPTLLARAGAQQVTAFVKNARGQMFFATANPGKLFRVSSERASRGTDESDAHDAQMLATWGSPPLARASTPKDAKVELPTHAAATPKRPMRRGAAWSAMHTRLLTDRRSRVRRRVISSGARFSPWARATARS